jgi:Tfp pilus assembly protein PilX
MKHAAKKIRRGSTAILAMLFLILMTTLSFAMFSMSTLNTQSASNLSDVNRARTSAESGLRWMAYRILKMNRPKTTSGTITASVADALWTNIATAVQTDFGSLVTTSERSVTINGKTITTAPIHSDGDNTTFTLKIQQHPLFTGDTLDQRYIRVTSTGQYGSATRSSYIEFLIDKKIKFAVVGKVEIQLGRNTLVQGPIAMATAGKYPPLLTLSDFQHFDPALKTKIVNYENFLKGTHTAGGQTVANHAGYDGRIATGTDEATYAVSQGYADTNGDNYIDEYDLFLKQYDKNGDKRISQAEFTNSSTGLSYDANLFAAIDSSGGPMYSGDTTRAGLNDGYIDNSDNYAKVFGQIVMATSASGWTSNLASSGQTINDQIGGPVVNKDPTELAVQFGVSASDIMDLSPANFNATCTNYRALSGTGGGAASHTSTVYTNYSVTSANANGTAVVEHTPYGSTTYEATYQRPVFNNVTFKNCTISKGTNALFNGCTFQGVTFVDFGAASGTYNMTNSATHGSGTTVTDSASGTTWSQRMKTGTFSTGTTLTSTNSYGFVDGNNLRFNNCTFNGPVAGTDASAYAHFSNSWEFTGSTMFNNQVDQTATIICPNTNIEMGSFTDPTQSPSTLVGVVVTGNIDIRGTSSVDGSIIVTGDGAGNTTLGYFGPSDSDTNPTAMPEGGYGRLNIRYNPTRTLPDGINIAVDITAQPSTYTEQ